MARSLLSSCVLLALSSYANAQFQGGGNPYSNGNPNSNSNNGDSNPFSDSGVPTFIESKKKMIYAHAIVATVAFGLLFPSGSILIRLGSFRGLWLVHGIFQTIAYIAYIGAAGLGVYIARQLDFFSGTPDKHIIIGLILLLLLFLQPFLGMIHHFSFKKHGTRVTWSYMHIWIGRIAITLGIINGGLGLQFAQQTGIFPPTHTVIVAYSVVAAAMWTIYMASAIYGEVKRRRAQNYTAVNQGGPPAYKSEGQRADGMRYA